MVIIASILELFDNKIFNTCLVISNHGKIIGKYRKHHIPPIELEHLTPGDFDCPVFETEFGKIGILICYERHFQLKWMTLALKGAQIIFNPSSEDEKSLSERMWFIEGFNAAVSNGVFTASINRVGIENFGENSINYFGSSYIASPYGFITDSLPRDNAGLLIADIDINVIEEVKSEFSFHNNNQLKNYIKELARLSRD
jgi:N-carbamoylputrescine amidase